MATSRDHSRGCSVGRGDRVEGYPVKEHAGLSLDEAKGQSGADGGAAINFSMKYLILILLVFIPFTAIPHSVTASDTPPLLRGYGGILAVGSQHYDSNNGAGSKVFSGEAMSNTEVTFAELRSRGYNGARVSIVDPAIGGDAASYTSAAWHRTLRLGQYYGITIIGDDHAYDCPSLSFWQTVIMDTPQSVYPNVLWETKNEPHCNTLVSDDQSIIDYARSNGDSRWFVLGCNNDCSPSGDGTDLDTFPVVSDPLNHVFYDFHEYFFYTSQHASDWTVAAAQAFADSKYRGALDVESHLGRPFLGTEFGADTGCGDPAYGCPPDQTVTGSAGYSPESLAYLSRLITDLHGAGMGYMIWNAGDWNDAPAGPTGAMDTFGSQLPLPPTQPTTPPPSGLGTLLTGPWVLVLAIAIVVPIFVSVAALRHRRARD